MKLKLLTSFIWAITFGISTECIAVPPQKKSLEHVQAEKEQRELENRKKLMLEYGISEAQAEKIQNYSLLKSRRVEEIKNSNLSQIQKKTQIQQIVDQYHNQVKSILPIDKHREYDRIQEKQKLQDQNVKTILKEYRIEFRKLENITRIEGYAKQAPIRQKYVQLLCVYIPVEEAEQQIRQVDIKRISRMHEISDLKLPKEQALEMADMKLSYQRQLLELDEQNLPNREKRTQREKIKNDYYSRVRALMGDVKYAQWVTFQNTSHERKYKKRFGFTQAQYEKYKEIENKKAIDILKIKRSAIPPAEKQLMIQTVKDAKVEKLQKILLPEQFEKWYKKRLLSEAKRKKLKSINYEK